MVRIIEHTKSKKEIDKILSKSDKKNKKALDLDKYFGKINWDIDPVEYQRKAREDRF